MTLEQALQLRLSGKSVIDLASIANVLTTGPLALLGSPHLRYYLLWCSVILSRLDISVD